MSEQVEAPRRESQVVEGLVCPRCGQSLHLVSGVRSLNFHCKSGHDWSLEGLLHSGSAPLRNGLRRILECWRRKVGVLRYTVSQALLDGHSELADTFRREAETLDGRIRILRSAFVDVDSRGVPGEVLAEGIEIP